MVYSTREVLEKTNYFVSYNWINTHAEIKVSWLEKEYTIRWDNDSEMIYSDYNNLFLRCPKYASPCIAHLITQKICKLHNFPFEFLIQRRMGNLTTSYYFENIMESDVEKYKILNDVYKDFVFTGLKPEHVELMKENDIIEGGMAVVNFYLGANIG